MKSLITNDIMYILYLHACNIGLEVNNGQQKIIRVIRHDYMVLKNGVSLFLLDIVQ